MPQSNPILCCSIAGKIGGLGVLMHNRAYREANLPAVYVSFSPSSPKEAVDAMRALGIRGMGVSMPYKTDIIPYLDHLDETARAIGAVNTVVNDHGVLKGYNTDCTGAIAALSQELEPDGKRAAVFGAGGVSRAILFGLLQEGAQVTLFNKSKEKGRALAEELGVAYGGTPGDYRKDDGWDLLVNATSVGFQTEETLLTASQIPKGCVLMDVVFQPLVTALAKEAAKAGAIVVPGTSMLIRQAIAQDVLYLGVRPSYAVMEQALLEKFGQTEAFEQFE